MQAPLRRDKPLRADLKSRKQEVEGCLAAFHLQPSGWLARRSPVAGQEPDYSRRLCRALISLGPIFAAFGRYLSSRIDLASVQHCAELAAIPDRGKPTPPAMVHQIIRQELADASANFVSFDIEPFESRLLQQSHRALLEHGVAVTVHMIRPEVREHLACDVQLLHEFKDIFVYRRDQQALFDEAIEDFHRTLRWQLDLSNAAEAFEDLADDVRAFNTLRVPEVHRALCTSHVLTLEYIPGLTLETLLSSVKQTRETSQADSANRWLSEVESVPRHWARLLCHVWLRQALVGGQFPIAFQPRDVVLLSNQQIAFTGGILTTLSANARNHLWDYMIAASTEDPDKACSSLLQEVTDGRQSLDEDELRYRFREIVPFRDSEWMTDNNGDTLIQYLFVHWRLFSERGLRVTPSLLCFYRGLFHTASAIQTLPAHGDPFLDGLKTIRMSLLMTQFQEMLEPRQLSDNLETYVTLMLEMPHKLDLALTLATKNVTRQVPRSTQETGRHQQRHTPSVFMALLLVLGAVVLVSNHLASQGIAVDWLGTVSTLVFLVLGALLLGVASRSR